MKRFNFIKTTKLMSCALCAAILAAFVLVGCEKLESYSIDAPSDLQKKIDSVAYIAVRQKQIDDSIAEAVAAAFDARLTEDIYQVGITDNSTGWWSAFSKYYRLATTADTVYLKFKNFTSGNNVWNTWIAAVTSDDVRQGDNGYVEYCIWRADNYSNFAWGTQNGTAWNTADGVEQAEHQTTNYASMATANDDITEWTNLMNGATCIAMVTRGGDSVYVDVQMTSISGQKLTKSFFIVENGLKDKPVRFFLFSEGGHLVIYKSLTEPLDDYIPDFELDPDWNSGAVEEVVEETPASTFRADVTATITTADDSVFTYTFYAEGLPYAGYGTFLVCDGDHMVIDPTETYYSALADTSTADAWYYPYSDTTIVGLEDNTTPWWSYFSEYTTTIGEGYFHYKFVNYSTGTNNWNNWVFALTNGQNRSSKNYKECFILRADAYGWGDYYVGDNIAQNYPDIDGDGDIWNDFRAYMIGATVEISLKISAESSAEAKSAIVSRAMIPGSTIE